MNTLQECELLLEFDRLDNPEYFCLNFQCMSLVEFFKKLHSKKQVHQYREMLNLFFDRLLDIQHYEKSIYVRMKWLIVFHTLILDINEKTQMFNYCHKALSIYLNELEKFELKFQPYEKYLSKILFRPYLQYLTKYCQLFMREDQKQGKEQKVNKWYKDYNLISSTLEKFDMSIGEVHNFFANSFPFLNSIGFKILYDIKQHFKNLKNQYQRSPQLKKVISALEITQLECKINEFEQSHFNFLEEEIDGIPRLQKQEISQFMVSPLKPKKFSILALTSCSMNETLKQEA